MSKSTSLRAQSSRVRGSSRRRIISLSERLCESRILNIRPSPRAWISPACTSIWELISELDCEAILVPLNHPEAEQRHERPDDEGIDEQRRAGHHVLEHHGADTFDVRRY